MRWNDFPIVRLILPFLAGIPFWYVFPNLMDYWYFIIPFFLILQFLTSYIRRFYPTYRWRIISTSIIFIQFFLLGVFTTQYHFPYNHPNYFGNQIEGGQIIMAKVIEAPTETAKSIKAIVEVEYINADTNKLAVIGQAMVYLPKDSNTTNLKYGNLLIFKNKLLEIEPKRNPESFDYKRFMWRKGIEYSAFLKAEEYLIINQKPEYSLKYIATETRDLLLKQLKKSGLGDSEYAIAASLLLGYREALTEDLLTAYRSAGVMHILCVSGMHVGILFMILSQIFSFLKHIPRGVTIRLIIILVNIWLFAIITGLSPSVTRAAVMFSFVAIGRNINRNINIYNTLAASALFTLVIDPFSLFDIGFQLSYTAVIAIAALFKPIYSLWIPRYKVPDYLWQIMAVSLAAQLGTAPISLYYFHQFPNYFLISNLIVIIMVTPIFYMALATILFSFVPYFGHWLGLATSYSIKLMNYLVSFFQSLPFSITDGIQFSPYFLILIILLIVFMSIMIIGKHKKLIFINLTILIIMTSLSIFREYKQSNTYQIVQFDSPGKLVLLIHRGFNSYLFVDSTTFKNRESISFQTEGYFTKYGLNPKWVNMDEDGKITDFIYRKNNFILADNQRIMLYSKTFTSTRKYQCDYLIIRDKKLADLEKLGSQIEAKNIILSNELWPNQKENLKTSSTNLELNLYDINKEGALIVRIKT